MIFSQPPPSNGDLHFKLLGIPVRIHPFFWLVAVLLGINAKLSVLVVGWIVALLFSILVHEMGHALVQRYYGGYPRITLYGMGGLSSAEGCDASTRAQILIAFAGPAAGFLCAILLALGLNVCGYYVAFIPPFEIAAEQVMTMEFLFFTLYIEPFKSLFLNQIIVQTFYICIVWGVVNLLPIYPLDGGQIARELFMIKNPSQGMVLSLKLSIVAGALVAFIGVFYFGELYIGLMFGYLAYMSNQTLVRYQHYQ